MWQWGPWAAADSLGLTAWPCMRVCLCWCVCMCHHVCVWIQGGRKWSTYETIHEHCSAKVVTPLTVTLTLAQAVCAWSSLFFCQLHHGWYEIRRQILVVAVTGITVFLFIQHSEIRTVLCVSQLLHCFCVRAADTCRWIYSISKISRGTSIEANLFSWRIILGHFYDFIWQSEVKNQAGNGERERKMTSDEDCRLQSNQQNCGYRTCAVTLLF